MSLGTNVNYLRRQKKMTQEQLAEQLCVTRQTVSRWETDEVTPELAKLVEMCSLFACSLDALVREDLAAGSKIYSDVTIRSLPPFRLAGYVMISPCPENDVNGYMDRWAGESGLKTAFPAAKRIGWDFPFVTPEQQNRFGLRGYAAAYVLPDGFETNHPGVRYFENAAAEYAAVTVRDPFAQSFERIPMPTRRSWSISGTTSERQSSRRMYSPALNMSTNAAKRPAWTFMCMWAARPLVRSKRRVAGRRINAP